MGLKGILSLLGKAGKGVKDYISERYVPNAMRTTRTDEGLDFLKQVPSTLKEANKLSTLQVMKQRQLALRKGQDLIDAIQAGGITRGPAAKRAFAEVEEILKMLESQSKTLKTQAGLLDDLDWAQNMMRQEYQKEKVVGLLKSLLPVLGAGAGGMYLGAKQQSENPEFFQPVFPDPDEAVEEMEEVTQTGSTFREKMESGQWGPDLANKLMDIISPIPRYTDINNGRE